VRGVAQGAWAAPLGTHAKKEAKGVGAGCAYTVVRAGLCACMYRRAPHHGATH
jgi:hypothetical protein